MSAPNIGFMTYNVNYSRRAVNEYEEYSWENRSSSVYAEIKKKVPEAALTLPGKLDHIFVKGFVVAPDTTPVVLDASKVPTKNFSPSDHYPIIAVLTRS